MTAELKIASDKFRRLIDLAIAYDGTYYLTYHRDATEQQLRTCYPEFSTRGSKRSNNLIPEPNSGVIGWATQIRWRAGRH
jgi:hypothetical protein